VELIQDMKNHSYLSTLFNNDPETILLRVEAIRTVGAEHTSISTDPGRYDNPPAGEGMRMFIGLLRTGITEHEIELMAKLNSAKLLGLD
jgi:hypothetical protein